MGDKIKYDVDGYDIVTNAIMDLINQFPGLDSSDKITFSILSKDKGKAMFPISGAVVSSEKEGITGHVIQKCQYPFYIIYRTKPTSEQAKTKVKEWLDALGRWLERQPIIINNTKFILDAYPTLTGEREFTTISRQTPGNLDSINENQSENWSISITAQYRNEFDR